MPTNYYKSTSEMPTNYCKIQVYFGRIPQQVIGTKVTYKTDVSQVLHPVFIWSSIKTSLQTNIFSRRSRRKIIFYFNYKLMVQ